MSIFSNPTFGSGPVQLGFNGLNDMEGAINEAVASLGIEIVISGREHWSMPWEVYIVPKRATPQIPHGGWGPEVRKAVRLVQKTRKNMMVTDINRVSEKITFRCNRRFLDPLSPFGEIKKEFSDREDSWIFKMDKRYDFDTVLGLARAMERRVAGHENSG